jgi:hypothetical protein
MIDDLVDSGLTMQTVQQKLLEAGEKRLRQHPARQQACCDLLLIGLLSPGDALWSSLHLHHCSVVISCCLMPVQGQNWCLKCVDCLRLGMSSWCCCGRCSVLERGYCARVSSWEPSLPLCFTICCPCCCEHRCSQCEVSSALGQESSAQGLI